MRRENMQNASALLHLLKLASLLIELNWIHTNIWRWKQITKNIKRL